MKPIFDLCRPRADVLTGELSEDVFAARLKDVMDGAAEDAYGDAGTFLHNTYPTDGLRTLIREVVGRTTGAGGGANAVVRLETAFGGGKTHNLIALYHIVRGDAPADIVTDLLGEALDLPASGDVDVVGVVGSDLDPSSGLTHPDDGVTTYTLWGELAYQLGRRAGYELARESDQNRAAPGTGLFQRLVGERPTLIMLDEIARHMKAAQAVPTATGKSDVAEQVVAFLMSLLEFAASKERVAVVITLASSGDAFADQTEQLQQALSDAQKVSARQERVLTPTDEGEIPAIVVHRLFERIDRDAANTVIERYGQYYQELHARNVDIPQRALRAEMLDEFRAAYPFHPELLNTLNLKTSTIPNFQRTRGALRLLAWTVRALWEARPEGAWLIHPHHLDLGHAKIVEDLTSRLDRSRFRQVLEADIASPLKGTSAHATDVDQPLVAAGKPPYARRLGTTVFLHSLTLGIASGVDPADLMLAVVTPSESEGDDPAIVNRALERLYDTAWFLEYDGHRYRFKTEPSLNKIVADETGQVGVTKAKAEIDRRVRQIWKKGFLKPVHFPAEPVAVDDDAELPKLAIMHYDAVTCTAGEAAPPDLVRRIYEYKGTLEAFRTYQNNLVFLVADVDQVDNMVGVARRYLAIGRITGDAERMAEFHAEQQQKLQKMGEAAELEVRIAITRAYRCLFYPSADAPQSDARLRRETLPAQEQGEVEQDQTNVVLRVLKSLNKVQTADDQVLSAAYVKSKAWERDETSMTTEDLRRAFAKKIALRMLLDIGQLKKTIQNGVQTGVWLYYDSGEEFAYDAGSPPPLWKVGDDTLLYLPEEGARLNLRIKGKWQPVPERGATPEQEFCPVCGNPVDECACGLPVDEETGRPARVSGAGVPAQAFQQILDQCQEHEVARVRRLLITMEGMGKGAANDLRALGLAIPQIGKGNFAVQLDLLGELDGEGRERIHVDFRGGWDRYKRLKALTDDFAKEALQAKIAFTLAADFEGGLGLADPQFETIRDVLAALEVGKLQVDVVPMFDT